MFDCIVHESASAGRWALQCGASPQRNLRRLWANYAVEVRSCFKISSGRCHTHTWRAKGNEIICMTSCYVLLLAKEKQPQLKLPTIFCRLYVSMWNSKNKLHMCMCCVCVCIHLWWILNNMHICIWHKMDSGLMGIPFTVSRNWCKL